MAEPMMPKMGKQPTTKDSYNIGILNITATAREFSPEIAQQQGHWSFSPITFRNGPLLFRVIGLFYNGKVLG